MHAEAIFDVLADAVSWEGRRAFPVSRDNAELELLEVLVALDTSNQQVVGKLSGNEALQRVALELEKLILLDVGLGDAFVAAVTSCDPRIANNGRYCQNELQLKSDVVDSDMMMVTYIRNDTGQRTEQQKRLPRQPRKGKRRRV